MDKIEELVTRGVANIIPSKDSLKKLLEDKKKLNVYLGIDPTATKIHLGHAVSLRKLQKFSELGHNVTFLIGDFTALIGDTSDKDTERPVLTKEQIEDNFKTYKKQAEKILDFSKIKVRYNSEWLDKLTSRDFIKLSQQFSFGDFSSRELIRNRLDKGERVGFHEGLYPMIQGYDSYYLNTDIQVGGTDQTFNMQAGRALLKNWRNKESFILANEFLLGTDGRKMSKSWHNAIWLEDISSDMYAKIMAINDELIIQYFTLATNISIPAIEKIEEELKNGGNPINAKKDLARQIVKELYGEKEAEDAENNFEISIQRREQPFEVKSIELPPSFISSASIAGTIIASEVTSSMSETKRLIDQGGISINDIKITDPNAPAKEYFKDGKIVIKKGKIKAVNVKIKSAS